MQIGEDDLEVAAEFPQDLAARAARRSGGFGIGDDGDAREAAVAFRQRFEHGDALGADRQTIGGIFDVAAGDDRPVSRLQRRADLEGRERRHGALTRAPRGIDERRPSRRVRAAQRSLPGAP